MSERPLYAFRLVVHRWPTPDGKPFVLQGDAYWNGILRRYFDPRSDDDPLPEWLPRDLHRWSGSHLGKPDDVAGQWLPVPRLVVPTVTRRAYFSPTTPYQIRKDLRLWGCSVSVERSEPIEWRAR